MEKRKKIAIIGSGISGLSAAYWLHPHHDITIYEKNSTIGGHSRTIEITPVGHQQSIAVDTGFIVFNHRNYPLLTQLFKTLNIPTQASNMSFGASVDQGGQRGWLEYGTNEWHNLLAQPANALRPMYWLMLFDILKFFRSAPTYINDSRQLTTQQMLDELHMGEWFTQYFLLPMAGAIWSCPLRQMLDFPASRLVQFFSNHGLLTIADQPQWYTVTGGSQTYVRKITAPFKTRILHTPINKVIRDAQGVNILTNNHQINRFDEVVFACHSDQALALLETPTAEENEILGAIRYRPNHIVVHSDTQFMPKRRSAWASWVYLATERHDENIGISLTYWMNLLQNLPTSTPILVTLNPHVTPAPQLTYDEYTFEHPVFDQKAVNAQQAIPSLQGKNHTWYCGAYQRYGFHEDGIWSSHRMLQQMGLDPNFYTPSTSIL